MSFCIGTIIGFITEVYLVVELFKAGKDVDLSKKRELYIIKWVFFSQTRKKTAIGDMNTKKQQKREEGRKEVYHKRHFMGVSGL